VLDWNTTCNGGSPGGGCHAWHALGQRMANVSFERDAAALKCLYCPRTTVSTCSALLRPALRPTLQFVLAAKPAAQLALPPCSQPCGLPCTSPLQPTLRPFGSRARPTVRLEACCSALPPPPYFFLYLFYLLPTYLPLLLSTYLLTSST